MARKISALNEKLDHLDLLAPVIVDEDATYKEVLDVMRKLQRGSVIVCSKKKVAGMFTERDVLNRCVLEQIPPATPIHRLMTPDPITISADTTLGDAIELMH